MFKAARLLFSGSLLGKLLGVVRELLLAAQFGTGAAVGAYRIAQTAVLIPINFFTADILNAGVIPLYSRYARHDSDRARTLTWILYGVFTLASGLVAGLLFWGAEGWVGILAPGLDRDSARMAAEFIQVLAAGVPFYVMGGLFSYLEMAEGGYTLASLRASLQSLGLIAGTCVAYWTARPAYLAWGFTLACAVFALWGALLLAWRGLLARPAAWQRAEVLVVLQDIWRIFRPLLPLPVVLQGSNAVERAVASLMGVGVVSALDYARFISETGMVLLAVPLGLAGLSTLSGLSPSEAQRCLQRVVPPILIATVPVSAFLALHSQQVIQVLYQRGAFDAGSSALTQGILFGLAVGFWAQVAGYVLMKALNAQLRNGEVLRFMVLALGLNMAANLSLYQALGPMALGLSSSLYGLILFVLSVRAIGIGATLLPSLAWLGLGTLLYVPLGLGLAREGWVGLLSGAAICALFWLLYISLVPVLRAYLVPLVTHLQRRIA